MSEPTPTPTATVAEGEAIVPAPAPEVLEAEPVEDPSPAFIVRHLSSEESARRLADHMSAGLARLDQRRRLANMAQNGTTEGQEEKRAREVREADVVEAARRSQAEIRRHVDAYLKEHLEVLVGEVAALVVARTTERVEAGIAAVQENVQIQLDRIRADVRSQVNAFLRGVAGGGGT